MDKQKQSINAASPAAPKKKTTIISIVVMIGFPIFLFLQSYLPSPGYWQPFIQQAFGIPILAGALVWLAIGAVLLTRVRTGWQRSIVFALFCFPVSLVPLLGPAAMTLTQAVGPLQ